MEARPKLTIPLTTTDRIMELLGIVGLITLWLLTFFMYNGLPELIPTHFNFKGEADDYGSRNMVWLVPGIVLGLFGLLTFLNRYPHQFNYAISITANNAVRQYTLATRLIRTLKLSLIIIFILLQWGLLKAVQMDHPQLSPFFLPIAAVLVLLPLGYFIWQSIKNR